MTGDLLELKGSHTHTHTLANTQTKKNCLLKYARNISASKKDPD